MVIVENEFMTLRTMDPKFKDVWRQCPGGKKYKFKEICNWANLDPKICLKHRRESECRRWPKTVLELKHLLSHPQIKQGYYDYIALCLFYGYVDQEWINDVKRYRYITGSCSEDLGYLKYLDGQSHTFAEITKILKLASPAVARMAIDRIIRKCRMIESVSKENKCL